MTDDEQLQWLLRLAHIVQALAMDTPMHDQAFDLVADIETLQIERAKRPSE